MAEDKEEVAVIKEKPIKETSVIVENSEETEQKGDVELSKKIRGEEKSAIVHIYSSGNNTIVHITDLSGHTISRVSGGMVTKHSRLKSNPTIAMFVAKRAAERAKDLGITSLYIRMKAQTNSIGMGPGAHAAVKSLDKEGFRIINILDITKVPRGGPKKKGGKRGRRV